MKDFYYRIKVQVLFIAIRIIFAHQNPLKHKKRIVYFNLKLTHKTLCFREIYLLTKNLS